MVVDSSIFSRCCFAGAPVIGGLVDGSDGARTGAKVGAGAAILTKGEQINIPAGTIMETRLKTALVIE